jgi:hypothetical protein
MPPGEDTIKRVVVACGIALGAVALLTFPNLLEYGFRRQLLHQALSY